MTRGFIYWIGMAEEDVPVMANSHTKECACMNKEDRILPHSS
jgi:hypothetical protein